MSRLPHAAPGPILAALLIVLSIGCGEDEKPTSYEGDPFVQTPQGVMEAVFTAVRTGNVASYEAILGAEFLYDAEPGGLCASDYEWDRRAELEFFHDFYPFRPYQDGYVVEEMEITRNEPKLAAVPGQAAMRRVDVHAILTIRLRHTETDSVAVLSLSGPQKLYFISTNPTGQNAPGHSWKLIRWIDQGWSCWRQMRHIAP